jgi:hypothetical protein
MVSPHERRATELPGRRKPVAALAEARRRRNAAVRRRKDAVLASAGPAKGAGAEPQDGFAALAMTRLLVIGPQGVPAAELSLEPAARIGLASRNQPPSRRPRARSKQCRLETLLASRELRKVATGDEAEFRPALRKHILLLTRFSDSIKP